MRIGWFSGTVAFATNDFITIYNYIMSAMAGSVENSGQDEIADVTECSICTEIFTNPRSLPCLHTFCLHCLESFGKGKKPGDQMACPLCRNIFSIPDDGFCRLPNNFFIGKLVEIRKLGNTITTETLCATCPEGERTKATKFCFECEQNLCERCGASHRKIKWCQSHQVVDIGNRLKPQEVNFSNSCCDQHPGELVKMYCEDDKATICFLCFAENHQSHRCVSVTKASEKFSAELKNDLDAVIRRLPECKDSMEKLKKLKTDLLENFSEVEKQISVDAVRLKELIDTHASELIQKLTALKDERMKVIETTKEDVERFEVTVVSYAKYAEELLNKGAPGDICREANQAKTKAQELVALPATCCGCDSCSYEIIFKPSKLEEVLRVNSVVNVIGNVQIDSSSSQQLGHMKTISFEDHMVPTVAKYEVTEALALEKQRRTFVVTNIPTHISTDDLQLLFESPRCGGGVIDEIDHEKGREAAIITFKESTVADALASKAFVTVLGKKVLIRKFIE